MNIEYTGRHTVVTDKLKEQAESTLAAITRVTNRCTRCSHHPHRRQVPQDR